MIYGHGVYFSVPKTLLKKLQGIDSKSIKLAIGVPEHTNKSYTEAGMISLSNQKQNGSVLDSLDSGAGFAISDLKVQKVFFI